MAKRMLSAPKLDRGTITSSPALDATGVHVSQHAVERYRERVHPDRSQTEAAEHLLALLPFGDVSAHAPTWLHDRTRHDAPGYLTIADVAFPLKLNERGGWTAVTCIPRSCLSEASRARRSARKRRCTRGVAGTARTRVRYGEAGSRLKAHA
jgi:hypothetical protein